jgi:predicted PolB exonuclease-like 3'-5' exonuclease
MTPILCFDLETIPDASGLRRLGLFDPSLDDAQGVAEVQAARQASHGSDFLPHYLQRVWVIGCAFRDQEGFRVRCLGDQQGASDAEEAARLRSFFKIIEKHTPQLVSWNGGGFDLPVLHHRALMHGVSAPRYWDQGEDDRDFKWNNYIARYHARHTDLMDVLSGYQNRAFAPLDNLARLCGFAGKLGEDGSKVWSSFLEGRGEAVRAYCETDVVNTYLLFCRFRMIRGEWSEAHYREELAVVRDALSSMIGQEGVPLAGAHWRAFLDAAPALSDLS